MLSSMASCIVHIFTAICFRGKLLPLLEKVSLYIDVYVSRFSIKLFRTNHMKTILECQVHFGCKLVSE